MKTAILSSASYIPTEVVTTDSMLAETNPSRFGIDEKLISGLMGIEEVRHADVPPSELAIRASTKALADAGVNPNEIGAVIFCGIEGDYDEPATAHFIQHKLGLKAPMCFDVSNACLGFMSGMSLALDMISAGSCKYALVCTGERSSEVTKAFIPKLKQAKKKSHFWNQVGALTVGDAGAAVILGPSETESGFLGMSFRSFSKYTDLCYYKRAGRMVEGQMMMKRVCDVILGLQKAMLPSSYKSFGIDPGHIDCLVTHQVGQRPWERYAEAVGVSTNIMTKSYDKLGNITSATFGVNFARAIDSGRINKGDTVFAIFVGSGLSLCHAGLIV